ncbi:MAG: hypothetical protein IT164_15085 [Bryobacterales bacterium]|nr:hypothetical protein [Bryobacterales bacterium]
MSAAFLTLVYVVFLFDGPHRLFRDSDTGWHIRTGERILTEGVLPRVDPYSFGKPGGSWVAWEWGADVLMGALHRWGGLGAVAWLYAVAIAACTWLWFQLQWRLGTNFLIACALCAPMLTTANIHWLARPHVFGWVLLLVSLLWLERAAAGARARREPGVLWGWWRWALLGALWANLHASFFLLPAVAALYGARVGWRPAAASALGTFANPYGWALHAHVARYLADAPLLRSIGEFQSFQFHTEGSAQIVAALLLSAAGAGLLAARGEYARSAVVLLLCAIAVRSARGLPVMALAALPYAGRALSQLAWPENFRRYTANLRGIDRRFAGWVPGALSAAAMLALLTAPAMRARTGFPADEFPVRAAAELEKLPAGARVFAPDKYGGYLIYRFDGRRRVFFDGRSDYYGAAFLRDYVTMAQVRPGWKESWRRHGFTQAVLPVNYSLNSVLEELGWRVCYRDAVAVIWTQP